MSKFNTAVPKKPTKTTNLAGGEAFQESKKLEFISILLTSFVDDKFYESSSDTTKRIKSLVASIADKKYLAKCAIYARTEFGMRSISHVVAAEIAKNVKGEKWTRTFFQNVVYRPDDITEILSYYMTNYGRPIPNSLKDGLAMAFDKFDRYQLAKYRSENKGLKLIDAVNLVHPVPVNEKGGNAQALKALVSDSLVSKETWESKLTQAGQQAETEEEKADLKKGVWKDLIKSKKIGYFALLRNLRNILEQAPDIVDEALELLENKDLIQKSLVLPFRFVTAINEIEKTNFKGTQDTIVALSNAVDISLSNVPHFSGSTLIALDCSGSMAGKPFEIGSLFAAALYKSNKANLMLFSNQAKYVNVNRNDSTLTIRDRIPFMGGGTDFRSIFSTNNVAYDRIIILSDMQAWMGHNVPVAEYELYKKRNQCKPRIYSFDLAGHGTLQFPENGVCCIAGFSEKVFDLMKILEDDKNALIHAIDKIKL